MKNFFNKIKTFFTNFFANLKDKLSNEKIIEEDFFEETEKRISDIELKEQNFHYFHDLGVQKRGMICKAITDLLDADEAMKIEIETIETEIQSLTLLKEETIKMRNDNRTMLKELMTTMKDEFPQVKVNEVKIG